MGQAFDGDGHVLGEAFGDTKREVFDKLTEQFKDAAEIRIKTMEEKLANVDARQAQKHADSLKSRDRMLQFFAYAHLPEHLKEASRPFCVLAERIVETLPSNPERTVALRKLLEAKDCAVRALLFKE